MKLTLSGPGETGGKLAGRMKALRLLRGWTQHTLASRAGVSLGSLKRFERTGKASLGLVLKVAHALGRLEEFDGLCQPPPARTIEELERRAGKAPRRRGCT